MANHKKPAMSMDYDSDDDIVFFAVKPIDVKERREVKETKEPVAQKMVVEDDDVVLLDDDSDQAYEKEEVKSKQSPKPEVGKTSSRRSHEDELVLKAVPSHSPVPLYPPPNLQVSAPKLSMGFFKRFKKSLDKMTKIDLEELVLQKIAEVIMYKSEFGEMRELIEKQEKIISSCKTKLTNVSKQCSNLEILHNRVLREIEIKNSQLKKQSENSRLSTAPKKKSYPVVAKMRIRCPAVMLQQSQQQMMQQHLSPTNQIRKKPAILETPASSVFGQQNRRSDPPLPPTLEGDESDV